MEDRIKIAHKSVCKRKLDFQQEEVSVVTVGGPTTDTKNPGQQSTETLSVPANSIGEPQPKKHRRKQQLVERTEHPI